MHCRSCELLLEEAIGKVPSVTKVTANQRKGEAVVEYKKDPPSPADLEAAVSQAGYTVGESSSSRKHLPWISKNWQDYRRLGTGAVFLLAVYLLARSFGLLDASVSSQNVTWPIALTVGLVAGVSTCMALVGGLILGISARHAERHPEATSWQKFRPHLYFNVGRVGGYVLLGGLLGALGSVFTLSNSALSLLTVVVGVVLVALGLKLTGLSPRLQETVLTLPSSLAKRLGIGKHQREYSHSSSFLTGALTFFLPCGFTQAMQVFAISTGSFKQGALVMGAFALGTVPALLGIGGLTSVIKGTLAKRFYATVGLAVLLFGIFNLRNGLALANIFPDRSSPTKTTSVATVPTENGIQIVRMTQASNGYIPRSFTIQKGVPVRWIVTSTSPFSCASQLVVPSLNISASLQSGENIIEFTPTKTGTIPFSCSMGMYRGSFTVVETEAVGSIPSSSGGYPIVK